MPYHEFTDFSNEIIRRDRVEIPISLRKFSILLKQKRKKIPLFQGRPLKKDQ